MIGNETIQGKKVFEVNFLDFCKIVTRSEKRTKFSLDNSSLMENIIKTRYSKKYMVSYDGIIVDVESIK